MGKIRNRLAITLATGAACAVSISAATGQTVAPQTSATQTDDTATPTLQAPAADIPGLPSPQTPVQPATQPATAQAPSQPVPQTIAQQPPSQQLITQQARRNPARRIGAPGRRQAGTGQGLSVTLDYLSSLRHDNNLRLTDPSFGSTTWWENTLALGVVNQTADATLTFDLSGLYRIANEPIIGTESEFADPFSQLTYQRVRADSSFDALLEYRERDLAFNRSLTDINLDGVIDAADVTGTVGDQIDSRGNLDWRVGINDPIGFRFAYNRWERRYQDTLDPDLFDNTSDDFALTTFFRINPVLQGNLRRAYIYFQAEDAVRTDRRTTIATVGATYDVSATTSVSGNIGYSQVDEKQRTFGTDTLTEDYVASFAWNRTLPDGSADIFLDRTFGVNGSRTNATFGRNFQRPNGSLNFNVGVTRGPFGETTPIGQLDYVHRLRNSQIGARIQRRVGTSTQSVETRENIGFVTYDYFINPLSALSFTYNFIDQKDEGPGPANSRERSDFTVAYSRAITNDWAVTMGYQYETDAQNAFDADSSSLYLTLGRRFLLKP